MALMDPALGSCGPDVACRPRGTGRATRGGGLLLVLLLGCPAVCGDDLWSERDLCRQRYEAKLAELATWCAQQGLSAEEQATRQWARPRDPQRLYLLAAPAARPPEAPADRSAEWQRRFGRLQHDQAEALFDLARRAIRHGYVSLAFELVLETARENPNHEGARRLLGYQRYQGGWHTPYEIKKLRDGLVWHEQFGWLRKAHVPRYEGGERFTAGRWISAADDAALHADIAHGWQVETEHYRVTTDHSLEAGVRLGVTLERFYRAWQQAFARYYTSQEHLARLLEGRAGRGDRAAAARFQVAYFRDRAEYESALRAVVPGDISITAGVYLPSERMAYFFADDKEDQATLYHEATHQLFEETRDVVPHAGSEGSFWILEGIACYMESFERREGYETVGGFDAVRLADARQRALQAGFFVPLADLDRWPAALFQQHPEIAKLYTQSAGMAHFLMHADEGRYRDALLEYLVAIYTGHARPGLLPELTGMSYEELDRRYRTYLESAPR